MCQDEVFEMNLSNELLEAGSSCGIVMRQYTREKYMSIVRYEALINRLFMQCLMRCEKCCRMEVTATDGI